MITLNTTQVKIKSLLSVMHWATMSQLRLALTGRTDGRLKALEYNLPRMVQKGLIKEARWGRQKVYSLAQPERLVPHGVACTECLIRLAAARPGCTLIGENAFKEGRFGVVPDAGGRYPSGTMWLLEYCTADNATRSGLVARKASLYRRHLARIEAAYEARAVVVFVIDLPAEQVERMATRYLKESALFFTDYPTFLSVPYGGALTAAIYFWGDGRRHPLSHD